MIEALCPRPKLWNIRGGSRFSPKTVANAAKKIDEHLSGRRDPYPATGVA